MTLTAVVIPCYKVSDSIEEVVRSIPQTVDHIIVTDDGCPDSSGRLVESLGLDRVSVLYHEENKGVGAATITAYQKAIELGCEIIIKIDGDGQMDLRYIPSLIAPLASNQADYTKGNRFRDFEMLKTMPRTRLFGNSVLSFITKAVSGYWNVMDPTNGFTAIHERTLNKLNLTKLSSRFFFESDMLIKLNIANAVVKDVDVPARYSGEKSTLRIRNTVAEFPFKLVKGFMERLFLKYFVFDFNMASVYMLLGVPMLIASVVWGVVELTASILTGIPRTAGTIMLVALPMILAFQMLLQAVQIDIASVPEERK
jgi:glycosyltransferase involved in cell wall biosynthesis